MPISISARRLGATRCNTAEAHGAVPLRQARGKLDGRLADAVVPRCGGPRCEQALRHDRSFFRSARNNLGPTLPLVTALSHRLDGTVSLIGWRRLNMRGPPPHRTGAAAAFSNAFRTAKGGTNRLGMLVAQMAAERSGHAGDEGADQQGHARDDRGFRCHLPCRLGSLAAQRNIRRRRSGRG